MKLGLRGNILNIIKSMYNSVKSRVKYCNELSSEFECHLGVRQGECLSPFLFSMHLNDIENILIEKGLDGINVQHFKMFFDFICPMIWLFLLKVKQNYKPV